MNDYLASLRQSWKDKPQPTPTGGTLLTGRAYIPACAHAGAQGLTAFTRRMALYRLAVERERNNGRG